MGPATRICRPEPRLAEARSEVRKNQDGIGRSTTIAAEPSSNTLNEPGIDSGRASWAARPAAISCSGIPQERAIAVAIRAF